MFFWCDQPNTPWSPISEDGMAVDVDEVAVILALKPPQSVTDVRAFLGMVGYYR